MRLMSYIGTQNKFTGSIKKVVADLLSSNVPDPFPLTGEGIVGLNENYKLLPGSTITVVNNSSIYMMNEEYEWRKQ